MYVETYVINLFLNKDANKYSLNTLSQPELENCILKNETECDMQKHLSGRRSISKDAFLGRYAFLILYLQ